MNEKNHISSSTYKYIPIECAVENAKLSEKIRKQDKQIKELFRENMRLRKKAESKGE